MQIFQVAYYEAFVVKLPAIRIDLQLTLTFSSVILLTNTK